MQRCSVYSNDSLSKLSLALGVYIYQKELVTAKRPHFLDTMFQSSRISPLPGSSKMP
jgi:hypothetical protein